MTLEPHPTTLLLLMKEVYEMNAFTIAVRGSCGLKLSWSIWSKATDAVLNDR
ncbi:hypothetical protein KBT16_14945 [Nostoc sp. CCCryo 231-06]|nr:hypothetical protein [Nostoc sp. CCCryo 231-06]